MAPGRPIFSVGIQPQIALWGLGLGSVCAFQWYTEKYRRNEDELDEEIKKLYLRTAQEAQAKMPQMAATIRGQALDLNGRMDKMVWGGKAKLKNGGGNHGGGNDHHPNNSTETMFPAEGDEDEIPTGPQRVRKRRKGKRKKQKKSDDERKRAEVIELEQHQKKLVLKSSIAGVAVGAVTVAAVSLLLSGGNGGRK